VHRPFPGLCPGRYHTRPAARRGVAGHRQVTGRAAARPVKAVGARGHQGGQCTGAAGSQATRTRFGWPDGQLSPKAVLTITVGHPVPVTHRPRACGAHGPVPRPGIAHRQTLALTGHHCDPVLCAPPKSPGHGRWRRGLGRRGRDVRPVQSYQDLGKGMTVRMCLPSNVTASPRSGRPLPGLGWLSRVPV
jgi:hypothetical protein